MANVSDILKLLSDMAPINTADEFDNVGLLCGRKNAHVTHILVALDVTQDVVNEAIEYGCELIVAHHPLMWKQGFNRLTDDEDTSLILEMAHRDVAAICMHTNLDRARGGINDCLAARIGLENVEVMENGGGMVRMGVLAQPMSEYDFALHVKRALGCDGVRCMFSGRTIYKVCVGGGACGEFIPGAVTAECDVMVTADVKYASMLYAKDAGISVIDAGHYNTEDVVCPTLCEMISDAFKNICVSKSERHKDCIEFVK